MTTKAQPRVSVLIPVYNREALIADSIRSALNQTVRDIEVVVVDNASTDATWNVCRDMARADPRVRVFRNASDIGPVRNWRRCLDEARGRFGKLLFSDDVLKPTFLERTLPFLEDPDVAFALTSVEIGPRPGQGSVAYRWKRRTGTFDSTDYIATALLSSDVPVSPSAALFRMDDLRKHLMLTVPSRTGIDFSAHGAGPDLLLYLLAAEQHANVGFVDEPVCFFRAHDGSISMRTGRTDLDTCYLQARGWFLGRLPDPQRQSAHSRLRKIFYAQEWMKSCVRSASVAAPGKWSLTVSPSPPPPIQGWAFAAASVRLLRRFAFHLAREILPAGSRSRTPAGGVTTGPPQAAREDGREAIH